jgi:hypothetical protein
LIIRTLELDPDPHWDLDPDMHLENMLDPEPYPNPHQNNAAPATPPFFISD